MINEELINELKRHRAEVQNDFGWNTTLINALDAAIEALEQAPKTGHWVEENINEWSRKVFCSECGCTPPFEHVSNGDIYSSGGYGVNNKTKFCPNCGARMEEQE